MTKYSTEFKIEVVQAYLSEIRSIHMLLWRTGMVPNPNQITPGQAGSLTRSRNASRKTSSLIYIGEKISW